MVWGRFGAMRNIFVSDSSGMCGGGRYLHYFVAIFLGYISEGMYQVFVYILFKVAY